MTAEAEFQTATLAKLYADQGYFDQAAEIYRSLIQRHPDRTDLKAALAAVENKLAEMAPPQNERLIRLFGQWIELMLASNRLRKLDQLRQSLDTELGNHDG